MSPPLLDIRRLPQSPPSPSLLGACGPPAAVEDNHQSPSFRTRKRSSSRGMTGARNELPELVTTATIEDKHHPSSLFLVLLPDLEDPHVSSAADSFLTAYRFSKLYMSEDFSSGRMLGYIAVGVVAGMLSSLFITIVLRSFRGVFFAAAGGL